jgi:hypothetical protein
MVKFQRKGAEIYSTNSDTQHGRPIRGSRWPVLQFAQDIPARVVLFTRPFFTHLTGCRIPLDLLFLIQVRELGRKKRLKNLSARHVSIRLRHNKNSAIILQTIRHVKLRLSWVYLLTRRIVGIPAPECTADWSSSTPASRTPNTRSWKSTGGYSQTRFDFQWPGYRRRKGREL